MRDKTTVSIWIHSRRMQVHTRRHKNGHILIGLICIIMTYYAYRIRKWNLEAKKSAVYLYIKTRSESLKLYFHDHWGVYRQVIMHSSAFQVDMLFKCVAVLSVLLIFATILRGRERVWEKNGEMQYKKGLMVI